jgi:hypothetical protein
MKCAANLNQAQDVKRRLQPAIRWAPDRPVEKEIKREPVRPAAYGERRFDRAQRERAPPRSSMISGRLEGLYSRQPSRWDQISRVRAGLCVRWKLRAITL